MRNNRRDDAEWSPRISLTRRILAVNIFALAFLAGGFFYLDSYRAQLIDSRLVATARETALIVAALDAEMPTRRNQLLVRASRLTGFRLRLYDVGGSLRADTFKLADPTYTLIDPRSEPWTIATARALDRLVETVAFADRPPYHVEPLDDQIAAWPEASRALATHSTQSSYRFAPDRTPFLSSAVPIEDKGVLLATVNARDITDVVRAERLRIGLVLAAAIITSVFLSFFLARTIVLPLRRLASAAIRVRLGRAREVIVPRLPERRDEIGMLARAVSDMSQALRQRIDATDSFAADVSHELKNPIASLRSALEGLSKIKDAALRVKLLDIAQDDVRRLDRLVTDIAETSRIDAQLSRTPFTTVDVGALLNKIVKGHASREGSRIVPIDFSPPKKGTAVITGDAQRLAQVVENLLDNARSFSPADGRVILSANVDAVMGAVNIVVEDQGPGVPMKERDAIFRRFHSVRPHGEAFGRHSGLGLSIARTIIEGHNGAIHVEDRTDGKSGARFVVVIPLVSTLHQDDEVGSA